MTVESESRHLRAREWWRSMTGAKDHSDGKSRPSDRAGLARLRRSGVIAAMAEEPVLRLFRRLGCSDPAELQRVAALACILAHVRRDNPYRFGRQIGRAKFSDDESTAKLKPLRFRRLLAASSDEEIATSFRRAVGLLGGEANVADLSAIILNFGADKVRRRLIFDYYATGGEPDDPAPATPPVA
ncbi:type I-E CRISPR-associated protein Cse2/CasB [Nordella sp. HKS 07]|uniref:type I-E CRISPR-associated protein Cse2/CasB n=1 Tax=Nordella sp. HKS 07 TaxID=2712222 RepID=UPI0013E152F2|nr:type I-E CRISPR-associated protein Cse2/CasB [Nordella sp. HKS 07]QIG50140.1 type I-E CRISPR-associated protein Cse2/CasB [Nordella sp. HKS 07]